MKVSLIAAMTDERVIGLNNSIPWHISDDMKRFKDLTMGKAVVMGRKTHESIGKPLPGRDNIIITRNKYYKTHQDCKVVHSFKEAIHKASQALPEIMIIGGQQIYEACMPFATTIYATFIHKNFDGDAYFPFIDNKQWKEVDRINIENVPILYSFVTYSRI